ncbi:hypothetical protein E8E13_005867 [Curvularia kusanoi]|uniref:Uncharacterized protein n=1 Tax=Curvularia kusanoi TaxID=90978 RepID=A0A9P4W9Y6_CURKU|nr:hypothetical protein E8E13_005867 [Curvularia kusanoi]
MDNRDVSPSRGKSRWPSGSSLSITVLGVCTGTGLGYLDCALVRFCQLSPSEPLRVRLQQFDRLNSPTSLKDPIISHLRDGRGGRHITPHLDELLGRLFSGAIQTFCRKHALDITSIDLVSTHSEVLRRLVARTNLDGAREHPLHWNSMVASETGVSTVFDFSILDRALNRPQTHPVSYFDRILLRHPTKFRVCLNLDEIANLSFIPPSSDDGARPPLSYDCGPGSLLIDYAMRYCTSNNQHVDHNGNLAAQGRVNQSIVDHFLNTHNYLRQLPPMSIATEMFGDHEAQQLVDECLYSGMSEADTVATVTQVTAQNILKQYNRLLELFFPAGQKIDELFICGSTSHNFSIIDFLESQLPESVITRPMSDIGIPGDTHEAVCYAYLAFEAVLGQATQLTDMPPAPNSAHLSTEFVRAKVVSGRDWSELLSHILGFTGGHALSPATDVRMSSGLEAAVDELGLQ